MSQDQECPFCQLLQNKQQLMVVGENQEAIAFLDINPRSRGHTLVMPKQHVEGIAELTDLDRLFALLRQLTSRMYEKLEAGGISITINEGETAGARVPHLALHVFPRYSDDLEGVPAGAVFKPLELEEDELTEIWKSIRLDTAFLEEQSTEATEPVSNSAEVPEPEQSHQESKPQSEPDPAQSTPQSANRQHDQEEETPTADTPNTEKERKSHEPQKDKSTIQFR